MDGTVYISHSRQNTGVALRLGEELQKHGIQTWLDTNELASGHDWKRQIQRAVKAAQAFVFVLGPSGLRDEMQRLEWHQVADGEYYKDPSKAMIPVLIGSPEVPGFLADRQSLGIDDSSQSISAAAVKIVAALNHPASTVDAEKVKHGAHARKAFFQGILQESMDLLKRSS